jgi:hypothetical protein
MKRIVDQAGSAAREHDRKPCRGCDALVGHGLAECPACGAPVEGDGLIQDFSTGVQPQLSRANFYRMREQYAEAEGICLEVLQRHPHDVEAHTLMGDIYSDRGQFEQASRWYELALDLEPGSFTNRQKLQIASDRVTAIENASTVEQLGLPQRQGLRSVVFAFAALAVIGLCAGLAYTLGQKNPTADADRVVRTPIAAKEEAAAREAAQVKLPVAPVLEVPKPALPSAHEPREDKQLASHFGDLTHSSRIASASQDPRTKAITVTLRMDDLTEWRRPVAETARDVLFRITDAPMVTMRVMVRGRLEYVADIPRDKMLEALDGENAAIADSWIPYVLTNEWYATSVDPSLTAP